MIDKTLPARDGNDRDGDAGSVHAAARACRCVQIKPKTHARSAGAQRVRV